jgi:K+-dependent Na+/Ca+ exchanger-like protein
VPCRDDAGWVRRGGWALHAVAILYLFLGIAIVCDDFFTPSLEVICEKLNLSEDVAGATFMAAGSSAPELFTSTMSLVSDNATNELGVATIVGSAVFNILIIVAATVLFSGRSLRLDWKPVTRDCVFYAAAIAFVLGVMADGRVWWWEGVVSTCLYLTYVGFMSVNATVMSWIERRFTSRVEPAPSDEEKGGDTKTKDDPDADPHAAFGPVAEVSSRTDYESAAEEEKPSDPLAAPDSLSGYPMWLLGYPWYAALRWTCPDCSAPGKEDWYLVSFVSSVVWISGISYGMVDSAAKIGCALGIPEVVMGTLVLAAGTSVPDALSSVSVAKAGQGDMAVANAVGSNVFDIWLGLGLPWLAFLPSRGGFETVSTRQLWPSVLILAGVLAVYYLSLACNKFELARAHGYGFVFVYVIFVGYSILGVWWLDAYGIAKRDE